MARGEAELGEVAVDGGGVASGYGGQYGGEAEILGEGTVCHAPSVSHSMVYSAPKFTSCFVGLMMMAATKEASSASSLSLTTSRSVSALVIVSVVSAC